MTMMPDEEKEPAAGSNEDKPSDGESTAAAAKSEEDAAKAAEPSAAQEGGEAAPATATDSPSEQAPQPGSLPAEGPLKPLWLTYGIIIALFLGIWVTIWFGLILPVRADPPEPAEPQLDVQIERQDPDEQHPDQPGLTPEDLEEILPEDAEFPGELPGDDEDDGTLD